MKIFYDNPMALVCLNRRVNPSVYLFLVIIAFLNAITVSGQDSSVRLMSFNIRYDNPADGINNWENRKKLVTETLLIKSPDLIGMQEVLERQLVYLGENLPDYNYSGVGREDGKTGGEYVPVFYKKNRFALLDNGTFWLSPTPLDTGSVGWDAALTRICTWGKFRDWSSGLEFFFLNTHFDHMGDTARVESTRLILDFIKQETNNLPVILTGDFNCSPKEVPYKVLTGLEAGLTDACMAAGSLEGILEGTFNGFGSEQNPERIDMVFYNERWEVDSYEVLKIKVGEMFISDHWPVEVELKIKK